MSEPLADKVIYRGAMYYVVFATGLVWREMKDHCKVVNSVRLSSAIWDHAYQEHMADLADARSY